MGFTDKLLALVQKDWSHFKNSPSFKTSSDEGGASSRTLKWLVYSDIGGLQIWASGSCLDSITQYYGTIQEMHTIRGTIWWIKNDTYSLAHEVAYPKNPIQVAWPS